MFFLVNYENLTKNHFKVCLLINDNVLLFRFRANFAEISNDANITDQTSAPPSLIRSANSSDNSNAKINTLKLCTDLYTKKCTVGFNRARLLS